MAAFRHHCECAHYQTALWMAAGMSSPPPLDPLNNGWVQRFSTLLPVYLLDLLLLSYKTVVSGYFLEPGEPVGLSIVWTCQVSHPIRGLKNRAVVDDVVCCLLVCSANACRRLSKPPTMHISITSAYPSSQSVECYQIPPG